MGLEFIPTATGMIFRNIPDHSIEISKVIFNYPATVVIWNDGTKTVVKCQPGDVYSKETGLALCIAKKFLGNKGNFNEVFKKWIPEEVSVEEMRDALNRFCDSRDCIDCLLHTPDFKCGRGASFYTCRNGRYDMTDDNIRKAYNIVLKRK